MLRRIATQTFLAKLSSHQLIIWPSLTKARSQVQPGHRRTNDGSRAVSPNPIALLVSAQASELIVRVLWCHIVLLALHTPHDDGDGARLHFMLTQICGANASRGGRRRHAGSS